MCYVLVRGTRLDISGQLLGQGEDIVQLREVVKVCCEVRTEPEHVAKESSTCITHHPLCALKLVPNPGQAPADRVPHEEIGTPIQSLVSDAGGQYTQECLLFRSSSHD